MVQVQLLGAVEARDDDGTPLEIGHRKGRAVLAALALDPGTPLPESRLIDLVWGDDPPPTARKTVQAYVSRLRSAVGAELVRRSGSGYVLDLGREDVDVGRFQACLEQGDVTGALAEWSGPPLAGLEVPGFDAVVSELTEQWLAAVEADLDSLAETDPAGAIAALTSMSRSYPFHEGFWASLMTALYRQGRQADALAAFREARGHLVDELGLEPGPRLHEVERMVLSQDSGLLADQSAIPSGVGGEASPVLGHLAPPAASVVGRVRDVSTVETALAEHRLVTLVGVGGVGKTVLGQQVGASVAPRFDDGAWLVELAHVGKGSMVAAQVAQALEVIPAGDRDPATAVADALSGSRRLVMLDNCEHVLEHAAALVEAILHRAPGVTILATSREALRLPSEKVVAVTPLDLDAGAFSPAVALFRQRSRAAASGLTEGDVDVESVVEICRRLDGLPLAIELAAARTVSMTCRELLGHLDDRFQLFDGARRGTERHQTLGSMVSWSYQLLDDQEQVILNRCSVFAGGFDAAAATSIAGIDLMDDVQMRIVLDSLVAKSLLTVRRLDDRVRFELLETIRQYAEQELMTSGTAETIRDRHAAYYSATSDVILDIWDGPDQAQAQRLLNLEFANLRASLQWAIQRGNLDPAVSIAVNTTLVGLFSQHREPIVWAERLLEPAERLGHPARASIYLMASLCGMLDRHDDGLRYARRGLELFEESAVGGPLGLAGAWAGLAHMNAGDPESLVSLAQQDVDDGLDRTGLAAATVLLGLAYLGRATPAQVDGAIDAAERGGNPSALAFACFAAGHSFRSTNPEQARSSFARCLDVSEQSVIRYFADASRNRLAALCHDEPQRALDLFEPAILGFHRSGDPGNTYAVLGNLAIFFERAGVLQAAAQLVRPSTTPMTVAVQPGLRDLPAKLIERLGEDKFKALAAKGKAMDRGQLVALALAEIDRLRYELRGPDR